MNNTTTIRRATLDDLPDIARIYNYAIENTTATFHTEPRTLEDWQADFATHTEAYPLLVAEVDGIVAGWGLIRPYGARGGYRYTVENAVYVDCDYQGGGLGSALLGELVSAAREQGYHVILALVVAGNEASLKVHEKLGFERVGLLKQVGRKFDTWLDLIVMEKLLEGPPQVL